MSLSKQGKDESRKGFKQVVEGLFEKVGGFWFLAKNWQIFTTKVYVNLKGENLEIHLFTTGNIFVGKGGKCCNFLMTGNILRYTKENWYANLKTFKRRSNSSTNSSSFKGKPATTIKKFFSLQCKICLKLCSNILPNTLVVMQNLLQIALNYID